ncbi:DNA adenine methylase [Janthinobacterium sp. NKUCC06_STL]|jgi:DNA adenine methylase|uniref:DNA adenine methylase n=1 Tax=Janthinobacterium sp. NKUCC06_STL TaxID=2842127 RepID=UPI001C5AD97F|nr:DNA adenine methylase [Janthinobacterium sp. NKUCC06_STL]MBW3512027.1 DNA adenine methylase [Janthinobacterium sp. NKUCC06_STL]
MAIPIIPWMGGKRRLANYLIPKFPPHKTYVEVFAGGAAIYMLRPPAEVEILNDTHGELVRLYRVVQNHLEEFVRCMKYSLASRQMFEWFKQAQPETLTDIQRAVRFFYLQQYAYGAKVSGQTWGTSATTPPVNLLRIEETLSAAHLRLSGAYIENLDWYPLMSKYDRPTTFFYLDPPYWEVTGYGVEFGIEQYEKMANLVGNLQGRAIISLNDHPDMRRIFKQFDIDAVPIKYHVGGAHHIVERSELVIFSWDRSTDPVGLFQ